MKRVNRDSGIFFCLLIVAFMAARGQNQQQPASSGSMSGMDMGNAANSAQPTASGKAPGSAMQTDMSHCAMNMGANSKKMDMGNGSASDAMNMSNCMGMMHGAAAAVPPGTLGVTFGAKSADWTPAQLAAMPQTSVTVYNEHTKATETYTGVPVIDLLTQVGVPATPRGKDLRLYLVAVGSDDYEAVYAVAEVNPSLHDATVIVADTENGKPLAGDGPLKLIDSREKRPARWVRNLVAIRVLAAE